MAATAFGPDAPREIPPRLWSSRWDNPDPIGRPLGLQGDTGPSLLLVPERKIVFRQNPNIEIRNSKQILISNDRMTKNNSLKAQHFCHWNICALVIVSDFVLRISSF